MKNRIKKRIKVTSDVCILSQDEVYEAKKLGQHAGESALKRGVEKGLDKRAKILVRVAESLFNEVKEKFPNLPLTDEELKHEIDRTLDGKILGIASKKEKRDTAESIGEEVKDRIERKILAKYNFQASQKESLKNREREMQQKIAKQKSKIIERKQVIKQQTKEVEAVRSNLKRLEQILNKETAALIEEESNLEKLTASLRGISQLKTAGKGHDRKKI
jgi:hypothetical protein